MQTIVDDVEILTIGTNVNSNQSAQSVDNSNGKSISKMINNPMSPSPSANK